MAERFSQKDVWRLPDPPRPCPGVSNEDAIRPGLFAIQPLYLQLIA